MHPEAPSAFMAGPSRMARMMREHDWSSSALGAPQQWPPTLHSVVDLMLGSGFPMFVAWGPTLSMLYNDSYAEILGSKHPASLGAPFQQVWSDILGDIMPLVNRALAGETFFIENLPLRMQRRGYEEDTWFTFSYSAVHDEAGGTAGFYCACTETTGLVLAERRQRSEQERLQSLFSQAPGFVAVVRGPDHVFEVVNPAYLRLTGHRDVLGKPVRDALPEVASQGFIELLDEVRRSGKPYIGQSVSIMLARDVGAAASEAFLDFVYQPLLGSTGQVEGVFAYGYDVTEQRRAQQALLAFSDSIPAIAWEISPKGKVERFNRQWESYTGQAQERSLGYGWTDALHPDDSAGMWQTWRSAQAQGIEWEAEHRLRRHDGVWRWFLTRVAPQLDAAGTVLRWFGTTSDIDDARHAAQLLRAADRQKDEFLATLAHELRNPLAPIRTAVHLLSVPGAAEEVRARAVEIVGRQVGHMSRLLDDLIDIARITQRRLGLKIDTVCVQHVVDNAMETARPLADAKRHTLTAWVEHPDQQVLADPVRLAQVLSNLLNNAAKYTDPGGSIRLEVRGQGPWLSFAVTDTGIGMSPEALANVFTMFAQEQSALDRSEGGLGIGLALAQGLVELHGGTISAHSAGPGQGSRFEVRLPVTLEPQQESVRGEAAAPTTSGPRRTILLADDNVDSAEVLAELLRLEGHDVQVAHDGIEAAAMAARIRPQIMLLDIGMPGLNGYEVAQQVRAQVWGADTLLIAGTGWGQDDDRSKAFAAGFDLHFTKPFAPDQLLAAIASRDLPEPVAPTGGD